MSKFIKSPISKITVCDYCRDRRCSWTKYDANNLPDKCKKSTPIEIGDEYVGEQEFNHRLNIAKQMASYNPNKEVWYLDPTVDRPLVGYELKEAVEKEVNDWSEENELELSDLVEYEEGGFEKFS